MAIKKTKLMKQMLAILLALAITVTSCDWPMTVYAEDTYHGEEEVQIEEPDMVCEVESERTEYTKHYLMTDGSYVAAVYSEPVHYLENGKWEEIDNTLTEETVEGTEVYQNRKGKHSVRFSESIDKKGVSIQNENGYTVSFTPVTDVERPEMKGERKETEELQSISMMKEEGNRDKKTEKMSLDKKTSGMKYADVYADADLEYVLTSSSLKENIVVKKAKDSYEYQFHADFGGLIPVQESDGSIGLYEEGAEQGLPEMRIEAPYMYDAEGTLSDAVTVTFEETEGHYIMMVTADPLWINDPERTFPVVIDPTVKLDVDRSDIKDTYVDTAAPSVNLKNDYYLTYYNDINQVVFDDACLYLDLYGSSYQYDSSGKLTAVSDGSGQSISYTYDGPDITKISQKFDGEEKESCSYTYDSKHNILTETTKGGVVTKYDYTAQSGTTSTYGNPTKVTVKNADGTLQSQNEFVYTSDYDYLIAVKDARGGTTTYDYDTVKGVLRSVTDAEGNQTSYTYDAATDLLLSVSGKADADTTADAAYEYKNDRLSSISHNGFSYGFAYDLQGRLVSVSLGGKNLITHSYNANGTVNASTYGNGDRVSYTYDSLDRVKTESYDGVKTYEYFYNKEGQVAQVEDYENALCTAYEYDFAKRLSAIHTSNGLNAEFAYDERNNLKSWKTEKNGVLLTDAAFTYKTDGLMEGAELPLLKAEVSYQHDGLNRTTETKLVLQSGKELSSSYAYVSSGSNQTGLVSSLTYGKGSTDESVLSYTYDANGNITTIKTAGKLTDTYSYDGLNQLIRHDDAKTGKTYTYAYDEGGNILSEKEYAYTTGTLGSVLDYKVIIKNVQKVWN